MQFPYHACNFDNPVVLRVLYLNYERNTKNLLLFYRVFSDEFFRLANIQRCDIRRIESRDRENKILTSLSEIKSIAAKIKLV